jgi:hypothetical protein
MKGAYSGGGGMHLVRIGPRTGTILTWGRGKGAAVCRKCRQPVQKGHRVITKARGAVAHLDCDNPASGGRGRKRQAPQACHICLGPVTGRYDTTRTGVAHKDCAVGLRRTTPPPPAPIGWGNTCAVCAAIITAPQRWKRITRKGRQVAVHAACST